MGDNTVMDNNRKVTIERNTSETQISLELLIDGRGKNEIATGVPFLDHMLELFSKHGFFDLKVFAKGDIEIDYHHLVEDLGIALGQAFSQALGDKSGIKRYGYFIAPGKYRCPQRAGKLSAHHQPVCRSSRIVR